MRPKTVHTKRARDQNWEACPCSSRCLELFRVADCSAGELIYVAWGDGSEATDDEGRAAAVIWSPLLRIALLHAQRPATKSCLGAPIDFHDWFVAAKVPRRKRPLTPSTSWIGDVWFGPRGTASSPKFPANTISNILMNSSA